jgi:hypothetical protein
MRFFEIGRPSRHHMRVIKLTAISADRLKRVFPLIIPDAFILIQSRR